MNKPARALSVGVLLAFRFTDGLLSISAINKVFYDYVHLKEELIVLIVSSFRKVVNRDCIYKSSEALRLLAVGFLR